MKTRSIFLALSLLLFAKIVPAQTGNEVSVTLMIPPPYSPYLSDYEGLLQNAIITLTNQTNNNLSLKLTGSMTGDNGFSAVTQPDYLPQQPITLSPFQTRTIVADRVALAFFDPNNIDLNGDQQQVDNVLRTGILPEGAYEICVRAVGYTSNVPLSAAAPSGCTMVFLEWISPPLLSVPGCGETLPVVQNTVTLAWLPVVTFPGRSNVVYDLYLVRVLLGQDPNDAMNAAINFRAGNPIVKEGLVASSYILTPADPPLEMGATYAYAVVARDPLGRIVFENGGRSEVCIFHTIETVDFVNETGEVGIELGNGSLGLSTFGALAPYVHLEGRLYYKFFGDSGDDAGQGFQMSQLNNVHHMGGGESIGNYGYQSSSVGNNLSTNSPGGAQFGSVYDDLQANLPPVPTFLFNSVGKDGARPLKNMRITFKAVYMTGNKQFPQSEADFRMVGEDHCFEEYASGGGLEERVEMTGHVLGTTVTNALGKFNFTGFSDGNTGVLATGKITFSSGGSGDVCNGSSEGWGLYRVITIQVESSYYCDPDIIVFAQPYQSMQLPDLTVYVRSYNLEVSVIADDNEHQIANAGGPIPDAVIRIGRKVNLDLPDDFPKNESRVEDFGQIEDPAGPTQEFIIGETGRAGQNGKFTFHRLVQHPGNNLQSPCPMPFNLYLADAVSDPNIGHYNYNSAWDEIGPCNGILSIAKPRNRDFVPPTIPFTFTLTPRYPEIYFQSQADYGNGDSNGNGGDNGSFGNLQPLPEVRTKLEIIGYNVHVVEIFYTDAGGLLRLKPFHNYFNHVNGAGVPDKFTYLKFPNAKPGFRCKECPSNSPPKQLQWGERWTPTVIFEPKGKVKGEIVDEFGVPVLSEVQVAEGPFVLTEAEFYDAPNPNFVVSDWPQDLIVMGDNLNIENPGGLQVTESTTTQQVQPWKAVFETKAPSGNHMRVIVQPLSSKYFPDTFYVNIPEMPDEAAAFDIGKFVVKQQLHRPRFHIVTLQTITSPDGMVHVQQFPVQGAKVKVANETPKPSNSNGYAMFVFASPEEEEFHVKVSHDDYITYDEYAIIPKTKDPTTITIILHKAQTISGKVTDAATGLALAGARVYAHVGTNEFGDITVEAFTNSAGEYTLGGLPGGEQDIFAAKSGGNKTYIGQEKNVSLPTQSAVNFQLQGAPFDMPNIWGIRVEIESFTPLSGGKYKVDGAFVNLPDNVRFKAEDNHLRLPFEDLEIRLPGGNGPGGLPKAEPVGAKVVTTMLKFRALFNNNNGMLVEISGPVPVSGGSGVTYQIGSNLVPVMLHHITVDKQPTGKGVVMGKVFTQLEYMHIEHQYDGQFYLGETGNNPNVRIFNATANWTPQASYRLFDYDFSNNEAVNPEFRVHNFPAFADRLNSYILGDSFVLATTLIVDYQLSNPDKIYVKGGKIIITPDHIITLNGGQKIQFELETWKVEVKDWYFSSGYGGIIGSGKIITNTLTIPAQILLRPDEMLLPGVNNVDLSTLSLAGVANLHMNNPVNFYFDYKGPGTIPHDPNKGHWRMQLTNSSTYVASVQNLPGLSQDVKIGHIKNYSDGFTEMTLPANQTLNYYNVISQKAENLTVHTDGFTLNGPVNLGIPNMSTAQTGNFTYYKEGGQIKMRLSGVNPDFETTGQISFDGDAQMGRIKLQNNLLEIPGWATIYEEGSAHTIRLRTKIVRKPQEVKMLILKVGGDGESEGNNYQYVAMGGGNDSRMKVLEGDQFVSANAWQPLHFRAELEGFGGGFQSGKNKLWFEVDGAIKNDQSKNDQIQLTNIQTPFGGLSLTFDFEDQAIVGNMHVQNIPMGAMNILEGTLETRMSGKGFYLLCQMDALYPVIGQVRTNFIAGSYPSLSPETKERLTQGMHIKKLPGFLNNTGIQGLFVCANKPVLEIDFEIDLVLFGAGLYADAGVDARFWMNFGESSGSAHIGAMMYADIEAYVQVLVCELCIGLNAELAADAEFQWAPTTEFSLNACGSVGVTASFCEAEMSEMVRLDLGWNSNGGFDLDVTLGESCSGMEKSDGGCVHF